MSLEKILITWRLRGIFFCFRCGFQKVAAIYIIYYTSYSNVNVMNVFSILWQIHGTLLVWSVNQKKIANSSKEIPTNRHQTIRKRRGFWSSIWENVFYYFLTVVMVILVVPIFKSNLERIPMHKHRCYKKNYPTLPG